MKRSDESMWGGALLVLVFLAVLFIVGRSWMQDLPTESRGMFACLEGGGQWNDNISTCELKGGTTKEDTLGKLNSGVVPQKEYEQPAISSQAQSVLDGEDLDDEHEQSKDDEILEVESNDSWWKSTPGSSWQWQLEGGVDMDVEADVFVVDLFNVEREVVNGLHTREKKVICHFSAGTHEKKQKDAGSFPRDVLGNELEDEEDKKWIDISKVDKFEKIMLARLDLAKEKGCDGVAPDNVDGYMHESGFELTTADQLSYNIWLTEHAHKRDLSIGLMNNLDQVEVLVDVFDFAINERCFELDVCDVLEGFIEQGKAVFGVEYSGKTKKFCPKAKKEEFSWIKKKEDLGKWREAC